MSQADDNLDEKVNWHWRNSMLPVRFFNFDARAGISFFVLLVYFRPITLFLTFVSTFTFWFLEKRGLTFPSSIRAFRLWLVGQNRTAWSKLYHRKMVDYG